MNAQPQLTITDVYDASDDVLLVTASDGANTYTARGWVSATTNHYYASAYGPDGHLVARALPRAMTPAEVGQYALRLVLEQNPQLQPQARAAIAFVDPAPLQMATDVKPGL